VARASALENTVMVRVRRDLPRHSAGAVSDLDCSGFSDDEIAQQNS
jgi:hypothetical protein